jgi:hypothetical protein
VKPSAFDLFFYRAKRRAGPRAVIATDSNGDDRLCASATAGHYDFRTGKIDLNFSVRFGGTCRRCGADDY